MSLSAATMGSAPDMHDFLYFVGLNGNDTVRLNKTNVSLAATFQYSKDRINWLDYTWPDNSGFGGYAIELKDAGDTVFFRAKGKNATMSHSLTDIYFFAFGADDQIAAGGNIMSLYDATCEQDTMTTSGFNYLFKNAKQLVSAPKLPAKKLAKKCYNSMFSGCRSLTIVPDTLPATTLALACYSNMFINCTSLTQAPALPATKLEDICYGRMFVGCTALTQAPELKATILAEQCYRMMFQNCTSLEVNTFSDSCDGAELVVPSVSGETPKYWNQNMFQGCKGTITIPQLGGHYCIKEYIAPYGRKVTNGNFGTICLDKKFIRMEGVEGLYVPATKDANYLYCEPVEVKDVKAGYAYFFKSNADSVTFFMEGEAVSAAVNNDNMIGWLKADSVLTEEIDYYFLNGNTIVKPAVGSKIKQNRAMIDLDNVSDGTPAPGRRYVAFGVGGKNTTTGVEQVAEKRMNNGQLIIIRDGRKFNAQGQEL